MSNKTLESRLVKETKGLTPISDHDLVVYRIDHGSRIYQATLCPGETFRLKIWETARSFKGFAVNKDVNLRFDESVEVYLSNGIHWFTLYINVEYRVINSHLVVEKLESDPLGRLHSKIKDVLREGAAKLDWEDVINQNGRFSELVRDHEIQDSGHTYSRFDLLQNFSAELGLRLNAIQLSRSIPGKFIEVDQKIIDVNAEERVRDLETQVKINDLRRDERVNKVRHEIDLENIKRGSVETKEKHRLDIESHEDLSRVNSFKRGEALRDALLEDVQILIDQASNSVEDFKDFAVAVNTLVGIAAEMGQAHRQDGSTSGTPNPLQGMTPGLVGAATSGVISTTANFLVEGVSIIQGLRGDQRLLLSHFLHMMAETMLQDLGSDEKRVAYSKKLAAGVQSVRTQLDPEQMEFFRRVLDKETMQDVFA